MEAKEVLFSVPSVAPNVVHNVAPSVVNSAVLSVHRLIIRVLMLLTHRKYREEYSEELRLSSGKNKCYCTEYEIIAGFFQKILVINSAFQKNGERIMSSILEVKRS